MASGFSIFCDDIRPEMGGKLSYMGVYQAVMFVPVSFPLTLPKFGVGIIYEEPMPAPGSAVRGDVKFKIFVPGDTDDRTILDTDIARNQIMPPSGAERPTDVPHDSDMIIRAQFSIMFAPLVIDKPGYIRVRAFCDGEVIKLGTLQVALQPNPSPSQS